MIVAELRDLRSSCEAQKLMREGLTTGGKSDIEHDYFLCVANCSTSFMYGKLRVLWVRRAPK